MDDQSTKALPTVPRPKNGNKFKCTLAGEKKIQTLVLRVDTLALLRQRALEQGLSISEAADSLIADGLKLKKRATFQF